MIHWSWLALWTVLLMGSANLGVWAVVWLTRIPPLPNCEEISPFNSRSDRLVCAKTYLKASGAKGLTEAVQLTADWPKTHSGYQEAQRVLKTASEKLLVLANVRAQAGDLEAAVNLASAIPLGTPLRKPAQGVIYSWRREWEQGSELESQIREAIQRRDWESARETLQRLQWLNLDYWLRDRHRHWQTQLSMQKQSWEHLQQARALAQQETLEALQQAIVRARQVSLGSHVWQDAEAEIDRWSQILMDNALVFWSQGNLQAAIAIAQGLPPDRDWPAKAQELIYFSHGQRLAAQTVAQSPSFLPDYGQLFQLLEAIKSVEQISPESAFYGAAQAHRQEWRIQLQDLVELQAANVIASIGQEASYRMAISQAQQVSLDRPRRLQGQTLIAHWRNQIERIQDRPMLMAADRLARPGTIPALQAAIAKAAEVELGRALRIEAQTRIADWRREIQVIEDRPLLDEAVNLAAQNQLQNAIAAAQRVQPERVLYARAQTLISDWTRQIQIAEDQPLLDDAKDLAFEGSLTAAINLASQISPGRALYTEAQRAIAIWRAERDYIWSIWEAEGTGPDANFGSGLEAADNVEVP